MKDVGGIFYIESFFQKHIHHYKIKEWIVHERTPYQVVDIVKLTFWGKSVFLDQKIQSAEVDEFIYHEALVHPAMLAHPEPEDVYIIGGGEGATLREVLKYGVKRVIMCDIDEKFIQLAKKHLFEWHRNSFNDKRVQLRHRDARKDLSDLASKSLDVIISDLTEPIEGGPSALLFTKEFFEIIEQKLRDNGIFCLQAGSTVPYYNDFNTSVCKTLKEVFPEVYLGEVFVPSFQMSWGIVLAGKYRVRFRTIQKEFNLRFLNQEYLEKIFVLPQYLKNIDEKGKIIIDEKPYIWEKDET